MTKKTGFQPNWRETAPEASSFRSIFKWGAPAVFKHPNARLFELLKSTFSLKDEDFKKRSGEGDERVVLTSECHRKLSTEQVRFLENIVGRENIQSDDY